MRLLAIIFSTIVFAMQAKAQSLDPDSLDEDFVVASVVVASPGRKVYSAVGHTALRLQCPTHQLDYVYSYESEEHGLLEAKFLLGMTHGRTAAVPTAEYVQKYADEGRAVVEYELQMPIACKQELWRMMDEQIVRHERPYDFYSHSCGAMVFRWLCQVTDTCGLAIDWPDYFNRTVYEIGAEQVEDCWSECFITSLFQGKAQDANVSHDNKVRTPHDLVTALQHMSVAGRPILKSSLPKQLAEQTYHYEAGFFTPTVVASCFVLLALLNVWLRNRYLRLALLIPMLLLGVLVSYLVIYRPYIGCEWNWLVIPFSPLPFIFWRWRKRWALPMVAIIVLWIAAMLISPHQLVHEATIILAAAMALVDIEIYLKSNH